jgi:beta-phosphoglucomutase-like phosphatase (HAD superfamily)
MAKKKKRSQDQLLEEVQESLELLVNLVSLLVASDKSVTEAARALKMAGLDNQTIASVLNTTDASVRVLTANLRVKLPRKRR